MNWPATRSACNYRRPLPRRVRARCQRPRRARGAAVGHRHARAGADPPSTSLLRDLQLAPTSRWAPSSAPRSRRGAEPPFPRQRERRPIPHDGALRARHAHRPPAHHQRRPPAAVLSCAATQPSRLPDAGGFPIAIVDDADYEEAASSSSPATASASTPTACSNRPGGPTDEQFGAERLLDFFALHSTPPPPTRRRHRRRRRTPPPSPVPTASLTTTSLLSYRMEWADIIHAVGFALAYLALPYSRHEADTDHGVDMMLRTKTTRESPWQ